MPSDYRAVAAELDAHRGATTLALRRRLAAKAYARTAAYDAAIANWFAAELAEPAPEFRAFGGRLAQSAALRREPAPERRLLSHAEPAARRRHRPRRCRARSCPTTTSTTPTRPMSASPSSTPAARQPASSSSTPIPAALPRTQTLLAAYRRALACDPVSAFGGIVALNRTLDAEAARGDRRDFHRGGHRPRRDRRGDRDPRARRRTCGFCWPAACPIRGRRGTAFKSVAGGLLVQIARQCRDR